MIQILSYFLAGFFIFLRLLILAGLIYIIASELRRERKRAVGRSGKGDRGSREI